MSKIIHTNGAHTPDYQHIPAPRVDYYRTFRESLQLHAPISPQLALDAHVHLHIGLHENKK